jgi:hypothetical protein
LLAALHDHDTAALDELFKYPVTFKGAWFSDASCAHQFPQPGTIDESSRDAFVKCLAGLPAMHAGSIRHQLPDVDYLEYGPGISLEVRYMFIGNVARVVWLGYAAHAYQADVLPTVTADALHANLIGSDALSPETHAALAAVNAQDGTPYSVAWLKVCIDASGAITGVHVRGATSIAAGDAMRDEASKWTFRPFQIDGKAIPVCAVIRVKDPENAPDAGLCPIASKDDTPLVSDSAVKRIEGNKYIRPDEHDAATLAKAGGGVIVGGYELCLDEAGAVTSVDVIETSGLPRYDAKVQQDARAWRYAPVIVRGKPARVCTGVNFIYSEH